MPKLLSNWHAHCFYIVTNQLEMQAIDVVAVACLEILTLVSLLRVLDGEDIPIYLDLTSHSDRLQQHVL